MPSYFRRCGHGWRSWPLPSRRREWRPAGRCQRPELAHDTAWFRCAEAIVLWTRFTPRPSSEKAGTGRARGNLGGSGARAASEASHNVRWLLWVLEGPERRERTGEAQGTPCRAHARFGPFQAAAAEEFDFTVKALRPAPNAPGLKGGLAWWPGGRIRAAARTSL